MKVLRTLGDNEAFYFYEDIGKPTGEVARSLPEFLDKVASVKSESLMFHLQREDFQNWAEKVLEDPKLAAELRNISPSDGDDIRSKIHETVETRMKELKESSVEVAVEEKTVLLPYP
jgi:tryptophan 2,3-dioxygenase